MINARFKKPRYVVGGTLDANTYHSPWLNISGVTALSMIALWSADPGRTLVVTNTDHVVSGTKTWTFANGNFTAADKGATMVVTGTAGGTNDGTFTITTVTNATTIVTTQSPGGNQTFAGTEGVVITRANPKGTFSMEVSNDGPGQGSDESVPITRVGAVDCSATVSASPNANTGRALITSAPRPETWARLTYTPDGTTPGGGVLDVAANGKGY